MRGVMLPGSAQSMRASSAAMRCWVWCSDGSMPVIFVFSWRVGSVIVPSAYTLKEMETRMVGTPAVPRRIGDSPMSTGPYELTTQVLGPLPIINTFCDRLGLPELLETFLAHHDPRLKLAPAAGIGVVVVRNLVLGREPVYALGEWAAPFDPGLLGLAAGEARLLNDDRVGRGLARLFDADRASLLTRLVLDAVERFGIDCSQLPAAPSCPPPAHIQINSSTHHRRVDRWNQPLVQPGGHVP